MQALHESIHHNHVIPREAAHLGITTAQQTILQPNCAPGLPAHECAIPHLPRSVSLQVGAIRIGGGDLLGHQLQFVDRECEFDRYDACKE